MLTIGLLVSSFCAHAQTAGSPAPGVRELSFNEGWRFLKDSVDGAEQPRYNDAGWRPVHLPHDWSIEDLPNQKDGSVQGPFTRASVGKAATGFTEGGTGWYRKKFILNESSEGKQTYIRFDGVYMDADVWVNGQHVGNQPYGYTSFSYNITKYLLPAGKQNLIAVRAKNEGKNSRWYTGSGIYRNVWLTTVSDVHTDIWGTFVTTPEITPGLAILSVENTIQNTTAQDRKIDLQVEIVNPSGQVVSQQKQTISVPGNSKSSHKLQLSVSKPAMWTLENPTLYRAKVTLLAGGKAIDQSTTSFGIRTIQFDGSKGFLLNGKAVKLKGGCIHHDNGPLGAAAFDRAEERKVELLKKAGYNAIRFSHNPMSPALLDACDRLGMLVVNETFDMWEGEKLGISNGYHRYFKEWWKRDVEALVLRDRNHPSIIMWSIGNEIWEAADTSGYRMAKQLTDEVRRLDPTRAVTEAIILLPERIKHTWEEYQPHLANLDVDGYNYFINGKIDPNQRDSATIHRYETEHALNPHKLYMATEYFPAAALENWEVTEKYPFVIGGFSWTAMDYMGEAGAGRPVLVSESVKPPKGLMSLGYFFKENWPVFNAYTGDLDLIGNRKAASYYQNVVWRNSPIEILVHRPLPEGKKELRSPFGFPDELKSWTWPGHEGKKIGIHVYTRSKMVRLELNGKTIAEQQVPEGSITASFEVDYHPGTLIARGLDNGKESGVSTLITTGPPVAVRLVTDRNIIKGDGNDLSFVRTEVIDDKGNVVPYVDDLEIHYQLEGAGTLAGVGNGNPADMSSFQQPRKKVYGGVGMAIVRSTGKNGRITLKATANGLMPAQVVITAR
jgi:beta-galactosidase